MALYACNNDEPAVRYRQFTSDDLSHLYYDKDTLTSTGQYIVYKDTIAYLLNDTDIIHVLVTTEIGSSYASPFHFSNIKDIFGSSVIYFEKKTGFQFFSIDLQRLIKSGNAEKFFQVSANGINAFSKQYLSTDTISLDSALVLGKTYQNVYIFYPPEDSKTDIRLIYFAKKYGYIKIVKTDGSKLERIDKGK